MEREGRVRVEVRRVKGEKKRKGAQEGPRPLRTIFPYDGKKSREREKGVTRACLHFTMGPFACIENAGGY